MLRKLRLLSIALLAATLPAACAAPSAPDRAASVRAAEAAGLAAATVDAGAFVLHARLRRPAAASLRLAVFLEGDGFAWIDRTTPSRDPTPHRPVALALAARSQLPAVAYLGRPCQWVDGTDRRGCDARWWTTHRLAPDVLDAADAAIDALKAEAGAQAVVLIGHSSGGGLAALLAGRRDDIAGLVTVAGVTDLAAWTALHRVSPLAASTDPAAERARWADLPQLHLLGAEDRIVPPAVAEAWGAPSLVVPGAGHTRGWAERWPDLERRALGRLGLAPPPISAGRW